MGKLHRDTITSVGGFFLVAMASLVAIRYLFVPGFLPTHDGEYHLIRIYEFGKMLATGNLFPRWAPGLNSGYGVPLFIFFYPLPNYIGSLFHSLGWSLTDAFRWTIATCYMFATLASYFWLRRLFGIFPGVIGSIIGAFTPYWFVDIFVRGSMGEVLALGFVFAALTCIAYHKKTLLTFMIAGIILSHNILAMIFLPILFLYLWITSRSLIGSMIVGIVLTSYFWVPALVERGSVVGLNTVNFRDHFPELAQMLIPSWGTGFSGPGFMLDEMSYQIGIVSLLVFVVSLTILRPSLFSGAMAVALFLMSRRSVPMWERLPFLTNLQYPWRLLSIVNVVTPFLAAELISRFHFRLIAIAVMITTIAVSFAYTKPVLYAPRPDDYYLSRREFTDGTSSLGNGFSTVWMVWQSERPLKRMEIISGEGIVTMKQDALTAFEGDVVSSSDVTVRTNVAYYPGWRGTVDGKEVPMRPDSQGAISVVIPQGIHRLKVYFSETSLRFVADLVSLVCLFWLLGSTILKRVYEYRHRHYPAPNRS